MESTCIIFGCTSPRKGRGLCRLHYERALKGGVLDRYELPERACGPQKFCEVADCTRPVGSSTYCSAHWQRLKAYGSPTGGSGKVKNIVWPVCCAPDCDRLSRTARGTLCGFHAQRYEKDGTAKPEKLSVPCAVDGCDRHGRWMSGLCSKHYQTKRIYGDATVKPRWVKGVRKPDNYVYVTVMDDSGRTKQVPEHRIVMEKLIGRPLRGRENVHHKNGDRHDNRPENLELWSSAQPGGQRIEDKIAFAVELLQKYAPHMLS